MADDTPLETTTDTNNDVEPEITFAEVYENTWQWIDGLSSGGAAILSVILVTALGAIGWFWRKKADDPGPTINIYPPTTSTDDDKSTSNPEEKPDTPKTQIVSNRLPEVTGEFFGREAELQMLDGAWADVEQRIVQFVAPGGTGKTRLLHHWLNRTDGIDTLIAWSFYSQGAREDRQVSATPFFTHVFEKLNAARTTFATEEDKGEYLAQLLQQQPRCVLVLDGLEPLQHAGRGMRGELKDRAIRQLLKTLARQFDGLCILTTRIELPELHDLHGLRDARHVVSKNLDNLAPGDGVKLLQSLGVRGSEPELEKAVTEYGCHALALHLLGNALSTYLEGDVLKRDTLTELIGEHDAIERHAFKVMQAYTHWLADTPELKLLYLLGLFDHPIDTTVLQTLWQAQIPGLTAGIADRAWKIAIRDLRDKHHLLTTQTLDAEQLDCHPLIREYFGRQLRENHPDTWRQAHTRLYEYYKALPEKDCPDTLTEMQPLFSAVAHGCAAGLHQQALDDVYWPRIKRKKKHFLTRQLGAFSDDLATVAHFFTLPWQLPADNLTKADQAFVLSWAGFRLRALGRLREALEPMQAALDMCVKQEQWNGAASDANNLSELQLTLGNVAASVTSSQQSVDFADRSEDQFLQMVMRTVHAEALHQAGETEQALERFREAEKLQRERQPEYPHLYSLQGFRYCDLLLAQGEVDDVLKRAKQTLKWANQAGSSLLTIALDQLTLARAHHQQSDFQTAADWLEQAVTGLRQAGTQDHLPRGLLARAALYRDTRNPNRDFTRARRDLQAVYDIAEPSSMRLFLTDYHLEMARLLLAEREYGVAPPDTVNGGKTLTLAEHIDAAARLIAETGYKRRLPELQELQTETGK